MWRHSATGPQMSLKVKGLWQFYLMDKSEGQFHELHMFDCAIGLKRTLQDHICHSKWKANVPFILKINQKDNFMSHMCLIKLV